MAWILPVITPLTSLYANNVDAVGLANKVVNQVDNLIKVFQQDKYVIKGVVCIADHKVNFRKSFYKDYKAHRKGLPLRILNNVCISCAAFLFSLPIEQFL